jgi:hypothetical protein
MLMYVVRDVFQAKPGKAKELAAKFLAAAPHLEQMGLRNVRVLTDAAGAYWTVVAEGEVESLDLYYDIARRERDHPEIAAAMQGYMELVRGGHREVLRVEPAR